ncbi:MAG TPA: alpha/beta fold hydrolase [Acidimicrobiales bacterium]|nr:alpha/beta fold hydrolase [Acidimicrobiales bacterium]
MGDVAWDETGSGPALVLVHGITEDRGSWDTLLPHLADRWRCVRLDLRGHGASADADDYSALAMAGDVAAVVAEAGIDEPPLLVGHSLGGVVVTAYAAGAPVRGVVNIDQSLRLGDFATALHPLADVLRSPDYVAAVLGIMEALGTDRLPPEVREQVVAKHAAARHDVILGVWSMVLDASPEELTAVAEELLGAVQVTYLAVHGSDPGPGYAEWLADRVSGATVEVWDGLGHHPHLVDPARFAARVAAFDPATG